MSIDLATYRMEIREKSAPNKCTLDSRDKQMYIYLCKCPLAQCVQVTMNISIKIHRAVHAVHTIHTIPTRTGRRKLNSKKRSKYLVRFFHLLFGSATASSSIWKWLRVTYTYIYTHSSLKKKKNVRTNSKTFGNQKMKRETQQQQQSLKRIEEEEEEKTRETEENKMKFTSEHTAQRQRRQWAASQHQTFQPKAKTKNTMKKRCCCRRL